MQYGARSTGRTEEEEEEEEDTTSQLEFLGGHI
jgi:hypothetical protein